jgi:DNA-binding LytR/AlgR family response regulator
MKFNLIIDPEKEEEITVVSKSAGDFVSKIENLVLEYNGNDELIAYADGEVTSLKFSEIDCISVSDRKTQVVSSSGKIYRINDSLSSIEQKLPSYFIRINKSSIANERRIKSFVSGFGGSVDAVFLCGFRDYVSRRCFSQIKKRYGI